MKKAVSMFLAAALAVGTFAGCGSSADTGSTGSAASTESGSTDSAADGSVFKIGGIGPTTGAAAIYGSAVMNAAQIAVDEINEAGGINGYQVEFKAEDDQSDAEKSVNAYNSLKDWGMQVLVYVFWYCLFCTCSQDKPLCFTCLTYRYGNVFC